MEKIVVKGGTPLIGEVQVSGAKNAALPILAAGLLATEGTSKFYNVPKLSDIKISPKGVCPLSLGRDNIINLPLIFLGNKTAFLLNGKNGFSILIKLLKSFVVAIPMAAP